MSIRTFNHDRAKELGLDVNSYSSYPPECFEVSFAGAVLDIYERNGRDDSDFVAIVWDEAAGKVRDVEYGTTRFWTYNNSAGVDATEEVKAKAAAYWLARHRATVEVSLRRKYASPYVGAAVTVIRGRKVPKGSTGTVLNLEEVVDPYKPAPRFRNGAWSTKDLWALVSGDRRSFKIKAEYLEVIPNPERTEILVAQELVKFDANQQRAVDWRSAPYQDLHYAGVNLANYA